MRPFYFTHMDEIDEQLMKHGWKVTENEGVIRAEYFDTVMTIERVELGLKISAYDPLNDVFNGTIAEKKFQAFMEVMTNAALLG